MKCSLIGLGKMGAAIGMRLLDDGHEVGVCNRTSSKCEPLVAAGAVLNETVGEAAQFSDVVISMLENDNAISAIALGEDGLTSALPEGAVHVAMGTHSVDMIEQLHAAHCDNGVHFVAAPVLGRPPAAAAGELGIIVGGNADCIEWCEPLFKSMGRRTYSVGKNPSSAAIAKIANNFVLAATIETLGEAFALGQKFELQPELLNEILTDGLFGAPAFKIYGGLIVAEDYFEKPGFTATTGLKDVNLALSAARKGNLALPNAETCRDRLNSAIAAGHGGADWSVMAFMAADGTKTAKSDQK